MQQLLKTLNRHQVIKLTVWHTVMCKEYYQEPDAFHAELWIYSCKDFQSFHW